MYTSDGFMGLPRRIVAAIPDRLLSPTKKETVIHWFARTFPSTADGASRLAITLTALLSLLVTFAVHLLAYPIQYASGVTLMWLLHETGHVVAARTLGLAVHAVWFIPFIGVIMLADQAKLLRSHSVEAAVGIAGPVSGFLGTVILYGAFLAFEDALPGWLVQDALIIFLLSAIYNGLQLTITIRPFDGGRVTQIIHPGFKVAAFVPLVAISALWPTSWVVILWLLPLMDLRFEHQWRRFWISATLALLFIFLVFTGGGRSVWWWNVSDGILVWLTLLWAWGQAKKDTKHWRSLPEWRVLVSAWKHATGDWADRENDRRGGTERRGAQRGDRRRYDRRDNKSARPIDLRHEGGAFIDRRGNEHRATRTIRLAWLLAYLATLGAHVFLGWGVYQRYLQS
jgi:hypothetical protein